MCIYSAPITSKATADALRKCILLHLGQRLHFDTRASSIEGIDAGSVVALCLYKRQHVFYGSLIRIDVHICRLWPYDDSL